MSFIDFKETTANNPGTTVRYGGNDLKEIMQILNGKIVASRRPRILNKWIWLDSFDVKSPAVAPAAPADTNTNRVYTDPTDFKLKIKKTGGSIRELETIDITDAMIAASGITTKSKLPVTVAYEDEANTFTGAQTINKTAEGAAENILTLKVSDDSVGFLRFENATGGAGLFAPMFRGEYNGSNNPSMSWISQCSPANDTGSLALLFIDFRRNDGAAITTRPYIRLRNAGALIFEITTTEFNLNTLDLVNVDVIKPATGTAVRIDRPSQAGTAEGLMQWQVLDDTLSKVELINATGTDAQFIPWLRFTQRVSSAQPAFYQYGYIDATLDTGTMPVIIFSSRRTGDANITTRPLVDWRNNGTSVLRINANGDILESILAQAGIAETLHEWRVLDADSYIRFVNASATDARFLPMLRGRQVEDAGLSGISIESRIEVAHDTGGTPVFILDSRTHSDTAIATRPLFAFRTAGIVIQRINPKGDILSTIRATASAGELIHKWQVSDNATAYFQLQNASAVDATFAPQLTSYNFAAGSTNPGLQIRTYVRSTEDSGSTPVVIFDARTDAEAALAVRTPLFRFRNAGTTVLDIAPSLTATFHTNLILSASALSSPRTFTFPNISGIIETLEANQTVSGIKTFTASTMFSRTAQASTAELIATFMNSDTANGSKIEILNATSTDAVFSPWIRSLNLDTAAPALFFYGYIGNALDTGSDAAIRFDGRKQDNTALSVRPVFSFRTGGTIIFDVYASLIWMADAKDILVGTTTGTKIGTATTQKLGFFNATPVTQRAANADTSGATLSALETEVNELKQALRDLGFIAP